MNLSEMHISDLGELENRLRLRYYKESSLIEENSSHDVNKLELIQERLNLVISEINKRVDTILNYEL